jgi:hypothetical protein
MVPHAPLADLRREHRAEPIPPETHRFIGDVDCAIKKQVLGISL